MAWSNFFLFSKMPQTAEDPEWENRDGKFFANVLSYSVSMDNQVTPSFNFWIFYEQTEPQNWLSYVRMGFDNKIVWALIWKGGTSSNFI